MARRSKILAATLRGLALVIVMVTACSSSSKTAPRQSLGGLTFTSDIEPLFREKCQSCHHEGGIAPFSLVTYEQVKDMGLVAKDKVVKREMPPWGPYDAPDCTMSRRFADDLSLSQDQIDTFVRWVDGGMARGDATVAQPIAKAPFPADLPGKTQSFDVATQHRVPALASDDFRCFPIDPGFTEDQWVSESMVVPGDPKVIHHALVYVDVDHEGMKKANGADSYPCFGGVDLSKLTLLLSWSPGGAVMTYGEDTALLLPKNAHLVLQVHYHPIQTETTGKMSIQLKTVPKQPSRLAGFGLLGNADRGSVGLMKLLPGPADPPDGPLFLIPSNAKNHTETMELTVPDGTHPTRMAALGAHMHLAGVGMKVEVDRANPTGGEPAHECVLNQQYDFNWQRTFTYDAPFANLPRLRTGDKLRITCIYDNTVDNPRIAKLMQDNRETVPPKIVLGSNARDEMCQAMIVFVDE